MSILKNPFFLSALLLTSVNRFAEYLGFSIPYASAYLDDIVCFPVVLTLALAFLRTFVASHDHRLSKIQIALAVIYFSAVFEWMLPAVSKQYTRDYADIVMYAVGAFLFHRFINTKKAGIAAAMVR